MDWGLFLSISKTLCSVMGFLTNTVLFIPLCRYRLVSGFTTVILRCQFCFDGLVCVSLLFLNWFYLDDDGHSINGFRLHNFVCRIWYTQTWYWIFVGLSSHNLIIIGIDRMLAIEVPVKYKTNHKVYLGIYIIYMLVVPQIGSLLGFATKKVVNGSCLDINYALTNGKGDIIFSTYIWMWTLINYMIPVILPVLIYLRIFNRIKRLNLNINRGAHTFECTRLVKPAFINTLLMCAFRLPENILTMMESYKIVFYNYNGNITAIFNLLVILVSCINPIIYYNSLPKLREIFTKTYHVNLSNWKNRLSRNVVSVESRINTLKV